MDRSEILKRFEQFLDTAMAEEGPPPGIPPEILPKVFDLFTQAERTLDRAEGGLVPQPG